MQTEDNTMNNITMNNELRSQLAKLGWNPDKVVWGKKLGGSPSHLTLLLLKNNSSSHHRHHQVR